MRYNFWGSPPNIPKKDGLRSLCKLSSSAIDKIAKRLEIFEKFSFFSSSKKTNFSLFREIASLVNQGKHLTVQGLREIIAIREKLNEGKGRKRKYNAEDIKIITKESSETIRQTQLERV